MAERQAWFCPACQTHHAPHCDSCPNRSVEVRPLPGVNVWPQPSTGQPYLPPIPTTGEPGPFDPVYWTQGGAYNPAFDPDRLVICTNGAH